MFSVLSFWYLQSYSWVINSFQSTLASFESQIAVRDTFKNLGRPIFQDYTFQGRFIGMLLRLARIGLGILLYLLVALVYLAGYIFWLLLPGIFLVILVGSLIGAP